MREWKGDAEERKSRKGCVRMGEGETGKKGRSRGREGRWPVLGDLNAAEATRSDPYKGARPRLVTGNKSWLTH